ncbi:hypothetical protein BDB00DRAFT_235065 [Zychaea mexicana]|uniref:uncharacterized protein n=1 Tax=Zychaea mexicana TaxID=64656 RepID=UPI0022FDFB43|nr:uncharacterized protein BDB00DRAFT_235065 [Zychaea mexicana]KAI9495478.1 hypothetical protein BDB00DRAFT_235065 [Zychaea mexicana]
MFYYGNANSNNDHHDNKPIPTNHHHHHHHHHSNRDQHHLDSASFSAGDSFPLYLEQQQQQQQQDPSSATTAQNIPLQQQQQHSTTVNDSSLYFDPTTLQPFDSSSFLNNPLLSLAGQEYDMPRGLDDLQLQHQDGFDTHGDLSAYIDAGSWNQQSHHNNNSYNSNNNENMMMAFSQQQQQAQPQHQQQHLSSSSLAPDNNRQHGAENAILNAFTALGQQDEQAILFSDPNFVRQQQLLQEQQRMMHMRQGQEEDTGMVEGAMDTNDGGGTTSGGSMMMRSNLSAMLDETSSSDDKADDIDPRVTCSLQAPSLDSSCAAAATTGTTTADRNARLLFSPATPAPEFKQQQQQQQQPWEHIATLSKKQQQQQQQRRTNNNSNNARASKRTSSPIPIKGIASSCNRPISSSVPSEVDHQRRQNELQARFRITYARKPQQQQQQQQQQMQQMQKVGSRSSAAMVTPSSFSGSSAAHVQQPSPTLGTSVPNFPSSNMKDFDMDSVMSSPQIALTPDPLLLQGSSSPLGNYQDTKGSSGAEVGASSGTIMDAGQLPTASPSSSATAIPGAGSNNTARAASKSPSVQHQAVNFPSRTMPIQIQRVQRASVPQPLDAEQHQRKLDDQLEKVNFDDITVSELKDMLRQRGKPATGKKAVLVQRLMEERDFIRAVKSGKAQRHSQPPLPSSSSNNKLGESGRPRSYQGTMSSPLTAHATSIASLPQSPLLVAGSSPSSMPNSFLPPGSPGSVTYSLNRSIANMHIGSPPPPQHTRRYSPYATPGSPRMSSASPKLQPQKQQQHHQQQQANYSSSMPTTNAMMSSSPSSLTYGSPLSSSFTSRARPINAYVSNGRPPKTYAPFTSSALATPDRDDDRDPFDDFAMEEQGYIKREEEEVEDYIKQENNPNDYPTSSSLHNTTAEPIKMEGLNNVDPASDSFLKNANIPESAFDYLSEGFTREDLLAVLAGQGLGDPSMGLQAANSIMEGYISNDTTSAPTNNMMLFDHLDNLNRYQHEGQQENGPR